MANSRYYSSIAQQTTLTSGITASGTSVIVASVAGFPGSLPYTLAIDYGSATEELVEVTGVAGTTLTVTRAIDGTSGASHNPGAVVRHVSSARDFTDSRTHEASSSAVHGVTGSVVGTSDTQTLTNKTVTHVLGSADNFKLYNKGAASTTQIIGDSTNPNPNRLEILDNESTLNIMTFITSNGSIRSIKTTADTDSTYRIRITDNDQTTDRFAVLAGGTLTLAPTAGTTFVPVDIVAADTSTSKRAIRVAASGGGTERFTVWNDGRVDIVGTAAAFSTLDVTAPAGVTAAVARILDSGSNTLWTITNTGSMQANKGAIIAQPGVTSGPVLQVGGSNTGYTGNLQQWVGPSNVIVASVDQAGNAAFSGNVGITGVITPGVTTGTAAFTVAANFTLVTAEARQAGGIITLYLECNYTGTTITSGSSGNIADTSVGTFASGLRPTQFVTVNYNKAGVAHGSAHLSSSGVVTLTSLAPTATIASGDFVRMTFTFVS